jgi:hypothetical protein
VYRDERLDIMDRDGPGFTRVTDEVLRRLIRQRIQDGRLPRHRVIELGFGSGVGQECDACGTAIESDQRMTVRISADDWRTLRLHHSCFEIWNAERAATASERGA